MMEIIPNWHPVWVHFTIGLLITGTVFYTLSWTGSGTWTQQALNAARWCLIAGALFAVIAFLTGWLAAGNVLHDKAGYANLLEHRDSALIAAAIFIVAIVCLGIQWRAAEKKASIPMLVLLLAGSTALAVTGFNGGAIVYEHGIGVSRLPDPDTDDHTAHHKSEKHLRHESVYPGPDDDKNRRHH